jgi:hypothetical protein
MTSKGFSTTMLQALPISPRVLHVHFVQITYILVTNLSPPPATAVLRGRSVGIRQITRWPEWGLFQAEAKDFSLFHSV